MYSQKRNCYFQNRMIMFCLPIPTEINLWEIYIFPGLVCLFCCMEICGQILGIYKSLTDTWMWKLGLRPRNSQKGILKWDFFLAAYGLWRRISSFEVKTRLWPLRCILPPPPPHDQVSIDLILLHIETKDCRPLTLKARWNSFAHFCTDWLFPYFLPFLRHIFSLTAHKLFG
jgi:hypothetical protein